MNELSPLSLPSPKIKNMYCLYNEYRYTLSIIILRNLLFKILADKRNCI